MLKQLSLDLGSIAESAIERSLSDVDSEPKIRSLFRFLNRTVENSKGGVGTYSPGGKKAIYFRFSYRDGKRMKHKHIPGGNIYSQLAFKRAREIQGMTEADISTHEILNKINSFR